MHNPTPESEWRDSYFRATHLNAKLGLRIHELEQAAKGVLKWLSVDALRDANPKHPVVILSDVVNKENK